MVVVVQDLGSAGGTYLRLPHGHAKPLDDGSIFLVGKHQVGTTHHLPTTERQSDDGHHMRRMGGLTRCLSDGLCVAGWLQFVSVAPSRLEELRAPEGTGEGSGDKAGAGPDESVGAGGGGGHGAGTQVSTTGTHTGRQGVGDNGVGLMMMGCMYVCGVQASLMRTYCEKEKAQLVGPDGR